VLSSTAGRALLGAVLLCLFVATVMHWPEQEAFWTREVWWEEETAREGMGLLIALLVSAVAIPSTLRRDNA